MRGAPILLGLDPGSYDLEASLDGFGTVEYPKIDVRVNRNTTVEVKLSSAIEETITVTSESPLLDERRLSAGTTVTQIELERIPTARDPWSLMSQSPGVVTDRINVGGSESGQQAVFRAQGVTSDENDFLMDGIQITDMSATGASPTYYDFDQFAEVNFTTGGTDITKNNAGLSVNMVTKRGTNEFRGSARFLQVNADGYFNGALRQASLSVGSELCTTGCPTVQTAESYAGARVAKIEDLGFEAGGAAKKDRIWFWGSWGQNDIKGFASSGDSDNTLLENTSIKINLQNNPSNSALASYNNGDKIKNGRGAGPTRSAESLWDQRGPSAIYRFEDTHVFSSDFFLTGTYSIVDLGFQLIARGPGGVPNGLDPAAPDPNYTLNGPGGGTLWEDNFLSGGASRPGDEFKVDGSYFFNTGNISHELKIGGRLRTVEGTELFSWGPRNVFDTFWGVNVARHSQTGPSTHEYTSLWAQDTLTFGNATLNLGLRFDNQQGSTDAATIAPHAVFPDLLPGFSIPAGESSLTWESITPRIGVTYAMGEARDTLLRASFAQFASQQSVGTANWTSPTYYGWYAYFYEGEMYAASYFDPLNPSVSPNRFGPGFDPELTTELIGSVEHALRPEFVLSANITWRNTEDIIDYVTMVRDGSGGLRPATLADYEVITTATGTIPRGGGSYNVPIYGLRGQDGVFSGLPGSVSGGAMLVNGGRERDYLGYTLSFTKRLANKWMARGFFNYGESEWSVPANTLAGPLPQSTCLNNYRGGGCRDGDLFVERATGSGKGERFLQSSYSWNLSGMYQVAPDRPWGFNLSANISGREGQPIVYYDRTSSSEGTINAHVVRDARDIRLKDPMTVDARIEKEFSVDGPVSLTFGIDAFNLFNENTGLAYQPRADTGAAGHLLDNVVPRVYRLGVRLSWQ